MYQSVRYSGSPLYYCQELEGYFAFWLFIPFVPFGLVVFSQFVLLGLELLGSFC